jgi:drug/metabolite transporter (DMT)-like permease
MGVGAILLVIALQRTDAVTAAIITSLMPVIGLGLEVALDRRRVTLPLVLGLILSLLGGIVAIDLSAASLDFGLGALAALASVFAFTLGSRLTVTSFPVMTSLGRTALTVGGAGIALAFLATGYAAVGGPGVNWADLGPWDYAAVVGASVGSIAVSQTLWIISVGALGIGIASLHMNAVPFYVMLMTFALGGAWDWRQAAGAAIVVVGVMVAQGMFPVLLRRA